MNASNRKRNRTIAKRRARFNYDPDKFRKQNRDGRKGREGRREEKHELSETFGCHELGSQAKSCVNEKAFIAHFDFRHYMA
jgi:hypothetical protein